MARQTFARLGCLQILAAWAIAGGTSLAADRQTLPSFAEIRQTVLRHFASRRDYRPGDVIMRSEVEPLFVSFKEMGWTPPDQKDLLRNVPPDNDFLVAQLHTRRGRRFMRRIASYPNAYDRLDRLSRMPHGKQTVRDLIRGPGGDEMIKYLTTSKGGKNTGKLLSNTPKGRNFNKPTGRIYTVEMLLIHLDKSYAATPKQ